MADEPTTAIREHRWRKRSPFGEHVATTIADLQRRYRHGQSDGIAALARLREAANSDPGSSVVPEACWLPKELLEAEYLSSDEASPSERALHSAVTLWALHQQSLRGYRMHEGGMTFAAAVQRLAVIREADKRNPETIHSRFAAIGDATTYRGLIYDVRSLISLLRDAKIGFDYGLFADDLRAFQQAPHSGTGPSGPERVRDRWGREYWRAKPDKPKARAAATTDDDSDDHPDDSPADRIADTPETEE